MLPQTVSDRAGIGHSFSGSARVHDLIAFRRIHPGIAEKTSLFGNLSSFVYDGSLCSSVPVGKMDASEIIKTLSGLVANGIGKSESVSVVDFVLRSCICLVSVYLFR